MKAKNRKKLILSMIQDDLTYTKLIDGLDALNLDSKNYCLNLSDKIVWLMGFKGKQNERIYEYYIDLVKRVRFINNAKGNRAFKKLAREIYNNLELQKPLKH